MFNKDKSLLIIIPVLMIGVGVFVLGAMNNGWQTTLSAFTLHNAFLSDAKDGTAPPDYRIVDNHKAETKANQKKDIILPVVLQEATAHRCGVLIQRLDEGKALKKFDVAYMMVCFDKHPSLFPNFFDDLNKVKTTASKPVGSAVEETNDESSVVTVISGTYYTFPGGGSALSFLPDNTDLLEGGESLRLLNYGNLIDDKSLYAKFGFSTWNPVEGEDCDLFYGDATIGAEKYEQNFGKDWSYFVHSVSSVEAPVCGDYEKTFEVDPLFQTEL